MCGFGQYSGNFATAFREENTRLLGERQKVARAFAEFKAQNPEATYEDFRSFVDSISGGDSFLRRSMPADEVLRRLGEEGEKRKAQAERARQLEASAREAQWQDLLTSNMRKAYESGIDVDKAPDFVLQNLNIEDEGERERVLQNLANLNPQGLYEKFDRDLADRLTRDIGGYINAGMIFSEDEIRERMPAHFLSRDAGRALMGNFGVQLKDRLGRLHNETVTSGLQAFIGLGPDAKPEAARDIAANILGSNAPTHLVNRAADQIWETARKHWAEVARKEAEAKAERDRARQERAARERQETLDWVLNNPVIRQTILHGSPQQIKEVLGGRLKSRNMTLTPELMDHIVTTIRNEESVLQDVAYQQRRDSLEQKLPELVDRDFKESQGFGTSKGFMSEDLITAIPNFGVAWAGLLQEYAADPRTAADVRDWAMQNSNTLSRMGAAAIQSEILGTFGDRLKTKQDLLSDYRTAYVDNPLGKPQRTEEYLAEARASIDDAFGQLKEEMSAIYLDADEHSRAAKALDLLERARGAREDLVKQVTAAANDTSWVKPDSLRPFTRSDAAALINQADKELRELEKKAVLFTTPSQELVKKYLAQAKSAHGASYLRANPQAISAVPPLLHRPQQAPASPRPAGPLVLQPDARQPQLLMMQRN